MLPLALVLAMMATPAPPRMLTTGLVRRRVVVPHLALAADAASPRAEERRLARVRRRVYREEAGVYGSGVELGYYMAFVHAGTPPQLFSVILDTGSDMLVIPCKGCEKCGDHSYFDRTLSTTVKVRPALLKLPLLLNRPFPLPSFRRDPVLPLCSHTLPPPTPQPGVAF